MNQKSTKGSGQRLQSYLLLAVMAVLSLLASNSFAQTCACTTSSSNLLTNGSFESSGAGWSVSGGSLTFGSSYAVCGSKNAYLNYNCNTAKVWQKVTAAAGGKTVTFKGWAGTHTRGIYCSPKLTLSFYNSSNVLLQSSSVTVDKDVDKPDYKLKEFTITKLAPANTYYIKVEGSIGCNTLKLDAMCLTLSNTATLGSIGDKVWSDANCNGLQDSGEPGICGVSVKLRNAAGTIIATTTTNSTGNYKFSGLAAANYSVVFPAALSGAVLTSSIVGSNRDIDSDPAQATGITAMIALAAGQNVTSIDAGYCANTMSLGNRVWYDANCNGFNDNANEPGLAYVKLNLYKDNNNDNVADGAAIATTTTDANGYYMFKNLIPGNYIVGVVTPAGYTKAAINGGDPDDNINLDNNGVLTVGTETRGLAITLSAGAEPNGSCGTSNTNITYDFGFCKTVPPPTICDCTNAPSNLLTNASFESGSTGWSVSGGSLTTGTGYVVCGYKNAFLNRYSGTAKVWQQVTSITPGSTVVFKGFAGTHTQGIGCSPKLTLAFYNSSNVLISASSVTVDKNVDIPNYKLKEYTIAALAPAGTFYTRVEASIGCNVLKLDALCLTATPPVLGCLGDKVWADLDADGIQDDTEPGIAGITVTLTYPNNSTATTTTNASGIYSFCSLPAGTYKVTFGNPGGHYVPTVSNEGDDDTKDSDPVEGVVSGISLEPGETNLTIDAGFILKNLNLGNFVWFDQNANGIQDAGEVGVAGVTVNLYADADGDNEPDGAAIATTNTNADGLYGFSSLATGKYIVGVVLPAGYDATVETATSDTPDNDDNTDNNGVLTTSGELFSNFITLTNAGEPTADGDGNNGNLTLDFGLIGDASLGNFVWNDLNADGIQDAVEPGIPGVTVTLTYPNSATLATVTNADGLYLFSNLAPGTYSVTFGTPAGFASSPSNAGADDAKDSDPVAAVVSGIALAIGEENLTIDAGFFQKASLGDLVFNDVNRNGIQDPEELGIPDIAVTLYSCADVLVSTTTTNANGIYSFNDLTPGSYYVVFTAPSDYSFSPANQGGDITKDSDADPLTGKAACVTLAGGESNITVDAGLYQLASLGDFVWMDGNANGIQEPGEIGIPNVPVTLYTCADVLVATTTTNATGYYSFTGLTAGSYYVLFNAPSGYFFSPSEKGTDITIDSDPNVSTFKSSCVTLAAGDNNNTIDAGLYQKVSLGNFVWSDKNNNGIQDGGLEIGFTGLRVYLYKDADGDNLPDGASVATAITLPNGLYSFTGLTPGKYIVGLVLPSGYLPGAVIATSANPDNDINTDNNGVRVSGGQFFSNSITLTSNGEPTTDGDDFNGNTTLDFGLACVCPSARGISSETKATSGKQPITAVTYKGFNVTGVYPNPFVNSVSISYTSESVQKIGIRIADNAGRTVHSNLTAVQAGKNNIQLSDLGRLAAGSYIIELKTNNGTHIEKLIK